MELILLPRPRKISLQRSTYHLHPSRLIALQGGELQTLLPIASRIQQALPDSSNLRWETCAGWALPPASIGLTLRVDSQAVRPAQGYRLLVTPDGMSITGHDAAGVFYGACTLVQVLRQVENNRVPCMDILDWPDFAARGVMLDISRDRVPQMSTLYELVDRLASWKINQIQLYTEHTFAYRNHTEVWAQASPMTGAEILELDAFCRANFIELIPNQNSFGHMERWLKHARYAPLAEVHGEYMSVWGKRTGPFGLAPLHPGSLELIRGLYDELLPHFTSRQFNVGCDETIDLGAGQSKEAVERYGAGRVYLDFLLKIYAEVSRRGYKMQFWGDIINAHPELVPELPRDVIGLLWGYDADFGFAEQGERFARAGVSFYMCPGTSSWNSLSGRTENALANLLNAAENGLRFGACGFLNTDWGDYGHWQALPVSFLPFAAGAAYSWCLEANQSLDVAQAASLHAFEDPTGTMGRIFFDLGNVYLKTGKLVHNISALFWAMQNIPHRQTTYPTFDPSNIPACEQAIEDAVRPVKSQQMVRPDKDLVLDELEYTVHLLRHACLRSRLQSTDDAAETSRLKPLLWKDLQELLIQHRTTWLARSRPGGYPDSRKRMEKLIQDYQ